MAEWRPGCGCAGAERGNRWPAAAAGRARPRRPDSTEPIGAAADPHNAALLAPALVPTHHCRRPPPPRAGAAFCACGLPLALTFTCTQNVVPIYVNATKCTTVFPLNPKEWRGPLILCAQRHMQWIDSAHVQPPHAEHLMMHLICEGGRMLTR